MEYNDEVEIILEPIKSKCTIPDIATISLLDRETNKEMVKFYSPSNTDEGIEFSVLNNLIPMTMSLNDELNVTIYITKDTLKQILAYNSETSK
jgi:hypothetical protein